jgi:hypothetical protein
MANVPIFERAICHVMWRRIEVRLEPKYGRRVGLTSLTRRCRANPCNARPDDEYYGGRKMEAYKDADVPRGAYAGNAEGLRPAFRKPRLINTRCSHSLSANILRIESPHERLFMERNYDWRREQAPTVQHAKISRIRNPNDGYS